jgi:hypothetical protein
MTSDLGVWTAQDCALVLIDYQREMFEVIRSETSADLVEMHVRPLARTATPSLVLFLISGGLIGAGVALDQGATAPETVLGFAVFVGLGVAAAGWGLLGRRPNSSPQAA